MRKKNYFPSFSTNFLYKPNWAHFSHFPFYTKGMRMKNIKFYFQGSVVGKCLLQLYIHYNGLQFLPQHNRGDIAYTYISIQDQAEDALQFRRSLSGGHLSHFILIVFHGFLMARFFNKSIYHVFVPAFIPGSSIPSFSCFVLPSVHLPSFYIYT